MVLMCQIRYCSMGFDLFLPGLESEVVGEVGLSVEQGLLLALARYQLALSQSETPLLYVDDYWIWQVAPHDKQWTENHLKHTEQSSGRHTVQTNRLYRIKLAKIVS